MNILTVCLGNICRSPAAQDILEQLLGYEHEYDSAGTSDYEIGNPPDPRSTRVCQKYGIDISHQRARQLTTEDGERFDLILVMDQGNLREARDVIAPQHHHKIHMFAPHEINDPYWSSFDGFEIMYQHLTDAAQHWVTELNTKSQ